MNLFRISSGDAESEEVEYEDDSPGLRAHTNGPELRGVSEEGMGDSMRDSSPELGQPSAEKAIRDDDEDVRGDENED